MPLSDILRGTPVNSVADAIVVMRAIDHDLPDADGVKWFNRLYLRVTEGVEGALGGSDFEDPAFIATLDVAFANLYFAALRSGDAESAPSAWRPLLRTRYSSGIARIQFALAGMNAHINRDLPEGIVRSFVELGGSPLTDRARDRDFDNVNDLLERVEATVKTEFAVGPLGALDRLGGPLDDAVAMWNVRAARATAWTNAQVLWGLSPLPLLRDRFFARLDSLVGMSGRGLLVRLDQFTSHVG
jgi:hypothetical protein